MSGSRLRVRFSKHGKVRFTSHRDVARIWERSLRRTRVPVTYSEGFNPRPKIAFGLALPTGYSSDAEYLDVEVDPTWAAGVDHGALADALTAALPEGMATLAVAALGAGEPSLQHAVTSCTWRIEATGADATDVSAAVSRALRGSELLVERERKGRLSVDDIRPAVLSVEVQADTGGGVRLVADLGTQPRAVRPAELLASLELSLRLLGACRLNQWIITDTGERREPLALAEMSVSAAGAQP